MRATKQSDYQDARGEGAEGDWKGLNYIYVLNALL